MQLLFVQNGIFKDMSTLFTFSIETHFTAECFFFFYIKYNLFDIKEILLLLMSLAILDWPQWPWIGYQP